MFFSELQISLHTQTLFIVACCTNSALCADPEAKQERKTFLQSGQQLELSFHFWCPSMHCKLFS
jgi:hypothetical protein